MLLLLLLCLAGPAPRSVSGNQPAVPPQGEEPGLGTKFSGEEVSVGYVLVPVIVRSSSGGYANRLEKKDFRLLVDGAPAPIESFEKRAEAPASILFLQDLSGSMGTGGKLEESRRAVRFFLDHSLPGDEFAIATFGGGKFSLNVPWTDQLGTLRTVVEGFRAYGTTALNDAVAWMPKVSTAGKNPKRFAILITDGVDNASTISPTDAREIVRRAELPVYVLGLEAGSPFVIGEDGKKIYRYADVLNLLAHETGGRYYPLSAPDDLGKALAAIVEDLRHEYVLGFATGSGQSRYRDLKVEVAGRNRSVLFRRGYKGPPPNSTRGG
ncbi:MAG TPA: VWA domain-containing protein [Thermoanaerobaculia bacterium]|nr:VWA domain-containing protein [Thermoanaerobaculia bacterium]